jgi:periplasmic divalent cation tolerance protein
MSYAVLMITVAGVEEGERIAKALVSERLAACVNIIPGVRSFFRWEGKIDQAGEFLMLVKTRRSFVSKVREKVRSMHSYTVPEIIALPVIAGNQDYLRWIDGSVGKEQRTRRR